jgi:branched-chain amino acid transport system substrate-binding protein
MKRRSFASLGLVPALGGCFRLDQDVARVRATRTESAEGEVVVGAVWPWSGPKGDLSEGLDIALEEINGSGGVLGRKLKLVRADDESSLSRGRLVAQEFAENLDMVAVIGHLFSFIALPASAIYEAAGLVYITPGATSHRINEQNFRSVFRSIASNRTLGRRLADHMAQEKYQRVAILYEKTTNTQTLSNFFEQRAHEVGLTVVDRRRFLQGAEDFSLQISSWRDLYNVDSVFLGARMQEGSRFIAQARRLGLKVPIVSGEGMDTAAVLQLPDAEGLVLAEEIASETRAGRAYHRFLAAYRKRHGKAPGTYPPVGYDTLRLLAHAMNSAGTTHPARVAEALRATRAWKGASGELSFEPNGDVRKLIGMKRVAGGRFVDVECKGADCTLPPTKGQA